MFYGTMIFPLTWKMKKRVRNVMYENDYDNDDIIIVYHGLCSMVGYFYYTYTILYAVIYGLKVFVLYACGWYIKMGWCVYTLLIANGHFQKMVIHILYSVFLFFSFFFFN